LFGDLRDGFVVARDGVLVVGEITFRFEVALIIGMDLKGALEECE